MDLICMRMKRREGKKLTGLNSTKLRLDIQQFKANGVIMFSSYQKLEMRTVKSHFLDNVAESIVRKRLFLYVKIFINTFIRSSKHPTITKTTKHSYGQLKGNFRPYNA